MSLEQISTIMQDMMITTLLVSAPSLLTGLAVGLVIAVFQAATQINEMTLSFVPKLLVMALAMLFAGHWMLGLIIDYTQRLMTSIPSMLG